MKTEFQMRLKKLDKVYHSIEKLKTVQRNQVTYTHYYIACLILHLYTGIIIKPTSGIVKLVQLRRLDLSRPLAIVIALFLIRR